MGKLVLVEVHHEAYLHQSDETEPDWLICLSRSQPTEPELCQGRNQVQTAAEGLTNLPETSHVLAQQWLASGERNQQGNHHQGRQEGTDRNILPDLRRPTLPEHISLGFERFDVTPYIPLPRRCFKCQQFGHGASTCRATENVCPLCSGTGHKQDDCPNKESVKCPNCDGAHPATSKECPAFITEKRALEKQAETRCTLPAAREQAGQTASAEQAASSYAQVLANNRADLVNRNLALSDENARLKEVINTLRQDNASLQPSLDDYQQRLQTLEKSMLGGIHADIAVSVPNTSTTSVGSAHNIGAHNTTYVGSTHNTAPVGDAHNTTPVGETHKPRLEGPTWPHRTDLAGTISLRLRAGSWNWVGGGQLLSQSYHQWQKQHHSVTIGKAKWLNNPNHNGCHNSAMERQKSAMYSSANKFFAVLRRKRSDPLSRSMGCIGERFGMSGLVRETSHLWLYSSPSPSLQPILRELATRILIALYTFECIMWVATESLWRYVQGNKFSNFIFIFFSPCDWSDALKQRISYMLSIYINKQIYIYVYIYILWYKQPLASLHFYFNWWNKNQSITLILTQNLLCGL